MKKKIYFKVAYWGAACAVILTGCSNNPSIDKKIVAEKEEHEEGKIEKPEMKPGSVSIEAYDVEDSAGNIVIEPETVDADWFIVYKQHQ